MTRILRRLETIYVKLDGSPPAQANAAEDEFSNLQMSISKQLVDARAKLQKSKKLEGKTDAFIERSKIKNEVKNILESVENQLDGCGRLCDSQHKRKDIPERTKDCRKQILDKLEQIYAQIKKSIDPKNDAEDEEAFPKRTVLKLAELKHGKRPELPQYGTDDDEQDSELLKEWKTWDAQVDDKLDDINLLLGELTLMNQNLGREIDVRNDMVCEANQQVTKVNRELERQNRDLFETLQKFREPSKLCMDCCMCVLLMGLVCVIVSLVKNGK
jgi:hypothetical protein